MRLYRFQRAGDETVFAVTASNTENAKALLVLYLRDSGEDMDISRYVITAHGSNRVLRFAAWKWRDHDQAQGLEGSGAQGG